MAFCLFRFARLRGTVSVKEWLGVLINKTDRKFIENKYHRKDEPFNPLNRMEDHCIGYDEGTGKDDEEIFAGLKASGSIYAALYQDAYPDIEDVPERWYALMQKAGPLNSAPSAEEAAAIVN